MCRAVLIPKHHVFSPGSAGNKAIFLPYQTQSLRYFYECSSGQNPTVNKQYRLEPISCFRQDRLQSQVLLRNLFRHVLKISKDGDFPILSGQPVAVLRHSCGVEFFLLTAWNFPSSVRVLPPLFTSCISEKSLTVFALQHPFGQKNTAITSSQGFSSFLKAIQAFREIWMRRWFQIQYFFSSDEIDCFETEQQFKIICKHDLFPPEFWKEVIPL